MPSSITTISDIDLTHVTGGDDASGSAQTPPLPIRRPCVPLLQQANPDNLPQCPAYFDGKFIGYPR